MVRIRKDNVFAVWTSIFTNQDSDKDMEKSYTISCYVYVYSNIIVSLNE